MYVCICNAITERELRKAAELHGLRSAAAFFESRHIGPVCGQCLAELQDVLQQHARAAEGQRRVAG